MTGQDNNDKPTIVIVEDEVLLALDLEAMAEEAGYIVVGQAARKRDAIAAIDAARPDLCLIDLHLLDGATGVDVALHAREHTDALVVFVTANRAALPEDMAGAYGVIAKPYTVDGMALSLAHLMAVLTGRAAAAEPPAELRAAL